MSENTRKPILYKGELYSKIVTKKTFVPPSEPPLTFEEARLKIISDIAETQEAIRSLPKESKLPNELILCLRVQPKYSAKSFYPKGLFTNHSGIEEIGSRIWKSKESSEEKSEKEETFGKMFFVRATEPALINFQKKLYQSESSHSKDFALDIRRLSEINLLSSEEQVVGFDDQWKEGYLEAVIHPLELDSDIALERVKKILKTQKANLDTFRFKRYGEGVTFFSVYGNNQIVSSLTGFNALRTMHPLLQRDLPDLTRGTMVKGLPLPPVFTTKPKVKVGIIDGGVRPGNKYLDNYVEIIDSVLNPSVEAGLEHGSQVTSAALYGPLNEYKNTDQLPEPIVSAKSFRVIESNPLAALDPDKYRNMYDIIDSIEKIVPAHKDLNVYNLSLGPRGPIYDDHITRFTFSLDLLSKEYNVLFCVAVGNDGKMKDYNRIQAPSDMVNGLAIGAYTVVDGKKARADYSCIGPGREGNKLKPDLLEFGGCERKPIQLIASQNDSRSYTSGTSFASPIISSVAAQLIGNSKGNIDALIARGLLIHSAFVANAAHSVEVGHGLLPENVANIVTCPDKSYTLIYQGEVEPGKYVQFDIPWINGEITESVKFKWTTVVLTNIDCQSPDDYTTSSIETTFYLNSQLYNFSSPRGSRKKQTKKLDVVANAAEVSDLLSNGWTQSEFPATDSGENPFKQEYELRKDLKWDSVDCRSKGKRGSSVKSPMFLVHAMNRGKRNNKGKVKFALILTVEAPRAKVDMYSRIVNNANFSALQPLKVELKSNVRVGN